MCNASRTRSRRSAQDLFRRGTAEWTSCTTIRPRLVRNRRPRGVIGGKGARAPVRYPPPMAQSVIVTHRQVWRVHLCVHFRYTFGRNSSKVRRRAERVPAPLEHGSLLLPATLDPRPWALLRGSTGSATAGCRERRGGPACGAASGPKPRRQLRRPWARGHLKRNRTQPQPASWCDLRLGVRRCAWCRRKHSREGEAWAVWPRLRCREGSCSGAGGAGKWWSCSAARKTGTPRGSAVSSCARGAGRS